MPLLLFDLDNTLLPRDAAFRAWAQDFLSDHGLPPGDLDWFVTLDGGGYVPRSTVLSAVRRRYGLDVSTDFLLAHYRRGINSHIHCPPRHIEALRAARAAGWTLGIVSNGGTGPQLEKIRRTGLGPLVDGWVISEEADCLKPDPRIFEIAAQRCGVAPSGDWAARTWMIGDHAPADIAGAELTGLRSVWLHHGRPWAEIGYRPTLKAAGLPEAVGQVLAARSAPSPRPGIRAGGASRRGATGVPVRATALLGARSGARLTAAAPQGASAPVPANAGTGRDPGVAAGSGVRNRSGGFAVIADARTDAGALSGAGAEAGLGGGADDLGRAPVVRPAPLRTAPLQAATDGRPATARTVFAVAPGAAASPGSAPAPATAAAG
ncbi:HAD family hydrolase [Kitasatospora xanthocidica]|uniref:HAD family hydrolase n=1 Tax=Kitasatospora xanthocidica TaxID=83382 RepID=UPI001E33E76C|nr:HAD family hydrolase [Kitasatospora xanthocidica]